MRPYNRSLKQYSRNLRQNMTKEERLLWKKIRMKQPGNHQFYRQKILGNYIVDFYCPSANLVIEIDGSQHYTEDGKAKDDARDDYLKSIGLKVLRFSNKEILENFETVLESIWQNVT